MQPVLGVAASALALFAGGYHPMKARSNAQRASEWRGEEPDLAAGKILFASEKLNDPNFAETVILLVQVDAENGTVGLVLNRRTQFSIAQIFPNAKHAPKDPVYFGGPVGVTSVQALLRLPEKTENVTHVTGDVYVSGTKELIDKSIQTATDPSNFRLYLGYAGWAPGQLEAEIRMGAWSIMNGTSKIVFDSQPESLWPRLTRGAHMRLAISRQPDFLVKPVRNPLFEWTL